ncbi:MAG TPA: PASTA domain-containing protein [Hungateiclostridium thermocellum]|uniref:Penicillin-binding protein transpeptidase n=2 Tax=Acetivibrio thermocellus TaxID=1515 RepID=A3DE32_ACET2|nr:PASTA domain-containing penicillin-binding protein [Acetivibrio thermocellus]ABN52211.1 penicillin-binding protein transpeptidase [Acetivibrio thermocellus ATCC 27405]ADU74303.1 penicillin-binding protein transpeptidase [Acetivibrio thermocellus DSM 1313]ALX08245.1 putative PASTA sensor protein [Acetivibrio thermocellus AD2]ANV75993.1 putative PASTA sensor protein [Acetivibrio thermocellus DSM 2360]EIC05997.1 penicillin-binding protein transpeptidase [Acetivibrio thermocellus YS]
MAGTTLVMKKRLLAVLLIFTFLIIALLGRVGWLQIVRGEELQRKAYEQQNSDREIPPRRGSILDRNGKQLAISATVDRIVVNPTEIDKSPEVREQIAKKLAEFLDLDEEAVLKKINKTNSRYEIIKKRVEKSIGDQIRQWKSEEKIKGLYIDEDTKRYYPKGNLAAHVIGFVGEDNQGLDGIEKTMEKYLKGVPGKILSEVDAQGRQMPNYENKRIDPQDGLNVVLTIDENIQYFAEEALQKAIEDNKVANGAFAIVMDPRNGEILALVSKPDFNLNDPRACPPSEDPATWTGTSQKDVETLYRTVWRNKAVSDTYEPGSTFKAITTAIGFEEGVVTPETRTSDRTITVQGHNIKCWKENFHGEESFREAVYNSCNPAFVKVALDIGVDKFYNYLRAFGFYDKTGIELPGEAQGNFHAKPTDIDLAVASFGQRFKVTPLEMIAAYGAIANGGKLIKPHLVKEIVDSEGNVVEKFEPQVVRNVISKETCQTLLDVLEGVVSEGTGRNAYVKGYRVAGKTGTSETDVEGVYVASFAAIAPADNPRICVLVALDNPRGESYYGGTIAAPVAGKIVEETLSYLGVERRYTDKDMEMIAEEVYVPDVRDKTIDEAKKILKEYGLEYRIEGDSTDGNAIIKEQTPKPGAQLAKKSVVIMYTYEPEEQIMVEVPDVTNKTIDEATKALNAAGLNIKVVGNGNAVKQSVEPGTKIPQGEVVEVEFVFLDTH